MPFILPIIGAVAGIAAAAGGAFLGISSIIWAGISLVATVAGSLLNKPKSPKGSQANLDRLRASIDTRTPRKTVVGLTAMATDIRDEELSADKKTLTRFIVVASHAIEGFDEIWFEDKMAWDHGVHVGETAQWLTAVHTVHEGSAANAMNISPRMGSTRRYTGLAYVRMSFNVGDEKSPFAQSVPSRITIRGKGAKLYDPRQDSSQPGGSGTHNAADQGTWTWTEGHARNPALQLLFYLLGWRINGKLAVGKGIPPARIDLESFAVAANICDELVANEAGVMERRYQSDGMWSEGDDPETVISMLKTTMNADLDDVDGRLRLTIFHNDLGLIDGQFTADDVLDDFEWEPDIPLHESFNVVRGVYTDPSNKSLYQPVDYPEVRFDSPDGIDRIFTLNLPMVESVTQAQRLARMYLGRQLYGGGTFKANFQATAWKVQKNSNVLLTFPKLGFLNKPFRVSEMDLRVDGVVPMVLREESPSIYDPPPLFPAIDPADLTSRNPALDPFLLALLANMVIQTTRQTVQLDGTGAPNPASQDTTFTLSKDPGVPVVWSVQTVTGISRTPTTDFLSSESGLSTTMTAAQFNAARQTSSGVIITATFTVGTQPVSLYANLVKAQDGQAGAPGVGTPGAAAVTAVVTRPAITLFAYANGNVASFASAEGFFKIMVGGVDRTASADVTNIVGLPTGVTATVNSAANTPVPGQPKGYYRVTNMPLATNEGTFTITATHGAQNYSATVSVVKAKGGYEIVSTLPTTGNFDGRQVYLTTDKKLYTYRTNAWSASVAAVDILGTITETQIAPGAITTPKLAANSVQANNIAANQINSNHILSGAVTTDELSAGAVTAAKVAASNVITISAQIASALINTAHIQDLAVSSAKIQDLAVDTLKIAGNAVTVPISISSGGSRNSPTNTYINVSSANVFLNEPGVIFAMATAMQSYSLAPSIQWWFRILIDGNVVATVGGSGDYSDAIAVSGSSPVGAGDHAVTLQWFCSGGITMSNDSLYIQGAKR